MRRPMAGMGRGGPMPGIVEKPKNFKLAIKKLTRYMKAYLVVMIVALVAAVAGTVLRIMTPDYVKKITNEVIKGLGGTVDMDTVWTIIWIVVGLQLVALLLNLVQGFIMSTVTQKISKRMRTDISMKINRLPLKYFNGASYGDVLSRVTNDVDTIGMTLNQSIATLVSATTMFLGVLLMMFVTSWMMALTAIGATFVGFILMMVIMKASQKYFTSQQEELGKINGHIEETYTGQAIVKVYNAGPMLKRDFESINTKLYRSGWKSQFLSGLMMPLMAFVGNIGYIAVCVVGAVLAMKGIITFGVIAAFMIYIRLFTQPLSQLAQAASNLQRTAAAGERVFEFLDEPEMENESAKMKRLENVKGAVEFKNVRFGYDEKIIINDFTASVKAGQKIAIVGPTGAGKTTMVNLLMRFFETQGGQILLDGVPTTEVPRENIHEQFCMVLQDTWLFEGTIRDNIVYSKQGVSNEQVEEACKAVGIHHFIQTLPDGYNTILNDKASLSEGEKQLLTIARAIIKNAPLLILDEATSSVDTRTERRVQSAMDKLMDGRTSFVIAHRLSTIKNADMIIVMRDGDIVESGKHATLLQKGGFYAELYNSQFETA
ncbi:MAG: ABC transporter ATP-binding protein/permease [Christensenellaceae bacterium]|nr:ABC transporter ATP-binding protein/permease [Christensenellaceae bacterium]